ncbi:MAG: pilus assembly protein TadG-related protein, partial [Deltaproteobacteria bacterium]
MSPVVLRLRGPAPRGPALYGNQDGAIMVIGVFIAILLCGLLFYVAGVGQIVFRRERMQDAADAVALATAIGHARGMNLIVFINLVMAALVAILLALKLIELLLTGLMLVLAAISWLVPPAAAAIPIVNEARSFVKSVHDAARDIVDN